MKNNFVLVSPTTNYSSCDEIKKNFKYASVIFHGTNFFEKKYECI